MRPLELIHKELRWVVHLVTGQVDAPDQGPVVGNRQIHDLIGHGQTLLPGNLQDQTGPRAGLALALVHGLHHPGDDIGKREPSQPRQCKGVEAQLEVDDVVTGRVSHRLAQPCA